VSYNGSGTFNINTAGQPVVTGTVISSTAFNALTADLGTGLSTAITKDGQTVATARIPFAQGINSSLVTDATSTTTGSIITAGGVGIAKALFVGTTANIAGTTTLAGVTATSITDSGLTSGRVTYAGTAGLLQDSANLTFNGTTLTANTIGAFTLSGTVAGGGNQLNNVVIGTTTPLAGAFTTLSATKATAGNAAQFTYSGSLYKLNIYADPTGTVLADGNAADGQTIYFNTASNKIETYIANTKRTELSSAGLAVTGTLSSTINAGGNTAVAETILNTGGNTAVKILGTAGGTAGAMLNARSDGSLRIYQGTTTGADGTQAAVFDSTGLAVTGLISSTGTNGILRLLNGNTAGGVKIGAYNAAFTANGYLAFEGYSSEYGRFDSSGNLGIGVTPSAWNSTYNRAIQLLDGWASISSNNSQLCCDLASNAYNSDYFANTSWKYTNTGAQASLFQQQSGDFKFLTAASGTAGNTITFTTAMTLTAAGNLSNTAGITSGTFTKATSYLWAAGVGTAGGVYLGSAGSSNGLISQASSGSGTTTTYIGNASITTVSDVRLKENVVDTTRNAIEILGKLRVVDHTWNDPSDQCENNRNSRGVWMGLIAQEAQPIIPWLVNKPTEDVDENGDPQYWHMDYGYSVPLLIKAIQEQQAIITALTTRITALEAK
jgi:hypothetical protein